MRRCAGSWSAAVVVAAVAACVSHSGTPHPGDGPEPENVSPSQLRWAGAIKPVERSMGVVGQVRPVMMNGTVVMIRDVDDSSRSHINITLSSPNANQSVSWALLTDRCGTGTVPVLPVNNFQPLDVGSGGRAEGSTTIPFSFPTSGTFHLDIYAGTRATLSDVIACADLTLGAK